MGQRYLPGTAAALGIVFFSACTKAPPSTRESTITAVPFTQVEIVDTFWAPRLENNRRVTIPSQLEAYAQRGRLPSAKLIEAAAYVLAQNPDPQLEQRVERSIEEMIENQLPEGRPREWKRLLNGELYSAGHFFEAAVAYAQATGESTMLEAARRIADDIDDQFGPQKRREVSQHEEVKIGLVRLFRHSGDERYLKLAKFFLDERGRADSGRRLYGEYAQDHEPVVQQAEAVGHTVRASYLYTSLADVALLTGESSYAQAGNRIWEDVVFRKSYLTGHIGSHRDHEDFGEAFELPNISAWNETCAAIGSVFWNHRLFLLHGESRYVDVLERILYNGVLVGISLDGQSFFYQNPLRTHGGFERHPWFGPNCCPPNMARLLASLGDYIYAQDQDGIYVNLFVGGKAHIQLNGQRVLVTQETEYPWDGHISIQVQPERPADFTLFLRIPGWCRNDPLPGGLYRYLTPETPSADLRINGQESLVDLDRGYARIDRRWQAGDEVELNLPMQVRRVLADARVIDNRGLVALERGPLVYCVEGRDNDGQVMNLLIPDPADLSAEYRANLLGGVCVITGKVTRVERGPDRRSEKQDEHQLVAVPYYSWANRGENPMSVWLAREAARCILPPVPTLVSSAHISTSCGEGSLEDNYPGHEVPSIAERFFPRAQSGAAGPEALFDQVEPMDSADGSHTYLRLRPQNGDKAWIQLEFEQPAEVSEVELYWKDDREYCRLPRSWSLYYRASQGWIPVSNPNPFGVDPDRFNRVAFDPVTTSGLRLEIILQGQEFKAGELGPPDANYLREDTVWYECGLIEWRVK